MVTQRQHLLDDHAAYGEHILGIKISPVQPCLPSVTMACDADTDNALSVAINRVSPTSRLPLSGRLEWVLEPWYTAAAHHYLRWSFIVNVSQWRKHNGMRPQRIVCPWFQFRYRFFHETLSTVFHRAKAFTANGMWVGSLLRSRAPMSVSRWYDGVNMRTKSTVLPFVLKWYIQRSRRIAPCYACRDKIMIEGTYVNGLIDTLPLCRDISQCFVCLVNIILEDTYISTLACLPLQISLHGQQYLIIEGAPERRSINLKKRTSIYILPIVPKFWLGDTSSSMLISSDYPHV